jgi:D-alanyl-D-alanine carboxypeptidase (penicillin-binding protein 5/6)
VTRRPGAAAAGLAIMLALTAAATPDLAAAGQVPARGHHPSGHGVRPVPGPAAPGTSSGSGKPSASGTSSAAEAAHAASIGGSQLGGRGVAVNYPAHGKRKLPRVPASAYVIADAGTGQVLAAKNAHVHYRPASTLKVLTAITLMPVLSPQLRVPASRRAADMEPSKVGLVAGRRYPVADLFRALLLISANDAAVSLAQATGSYGRAIGMMNTEARHLQADDTVAKTPNGLDARGQHVSAYDEALFDRQALRLPQFMRIEKLIRTRFPLRRHHMVTLWNQNTMLQTFPGDLGGKIGWTTPAGATFNGWARRNGHTLVVTVLHATPQTEIQSATKLLTWGFAVDGKVKPAGKLVSSLPATTRRARHAQAAQPARASAGGSVAGPVAIGVGTFVVVLALGAGITLAVRRRRAGSQPAP